MAVTRLIPMHENKGKSALQSLSARLNYSQNLDKTRDGELISAYGCDPKTAAEEFLLCRRNYLQNHASAVKKEVLAYQIRQSFLPGEITPEEANRVGIELAQAFTKGSHTFTVSTHIDRAHIHNHIIFCAFTLDGRRKFRNFYHSYYALQQLNDRICLEHSLSIVRNPGAVKRELHRYEKRPSVRSRIRSEIDEILAFSPSDFEEFLRLLAQRGYEIKRGKYISIRGKFQKQAVRLHSLGTGYTENDLRKLFSDKDIAQKKEPVRESLPFQYLIDIEKKLKEGKGRGYELWAKKFNLKQTAKVICYLQENGITDPEKLQTAKEQAVQEYYQRAVDISNIRKQMQDLSELRQHIFDYLKNREVFQQYWKTGYNIQFYESHREQINLYRAAKEAFNHLPNGKVPKIKELNARFAVLAQQKKETYESYRNAKKQMQELSIAEKTVKIFLEEEKDSSRKKKDHQKKKSRTDGAER